MKNIAIAPFSAAFLELFINIGRYLTACGANVEYLNPDKYVAHELRKMGMTITRYKNTESHTRTYSHDSELIRYHSRLYRIGNTEKFINIKDKEYSKCLSFFKNTECNYTVLFWNGSGTVEKDVVEQLGIRAFYFENGYFPDTLQVNIGGVNCNADFCNLQTNEFTSFAYPMVEIKKADYEVIQYKQNPFKRMLLRMFDPNFNFMVQEAFLHNKRSAEAKKRFAKLTTDQTILPAKGDFIFFPLQVNSDTQIILNSPYNSMYEAIEYILPELLKTGKKIVMKEHPFEVETVDYSHFTDGKNIILLKKFDLNTLIDQSAFTVNINSSVGLQAIERGGKVLLLGKSMYRNAPNCIEYSDYSSIEKLMSSNTSSQESYITHFKDSIFIKGNWKHINHGLLHQIAERVLA